jgi:hypothetical protein
MNVAFIASSSSYRATECTYVHFLLNLILENKIMIRFAFERPPELDSLESERARFSHLPNRTLPTLIGTPFAVLVPRNSTLFD